MADTLRIDRIRCDGHGLCAELLPEMISLDDWGYPIIKAGTIPSRLAQHAQRAVEACPVLALRLARTADEAIPHSSCALVPAGTPSPEVTHVTGNR